MKIIQPSVKLIDNINPAGIYNKIERCGRVSHQSESKGNPEDFIRKIIELGHESVLEHVSLTFHIICDRAIQNELVRHRHASFTVESTRYVKYDELTFIEPDLWVGYEWDDDKYIRGKAQIQHSNWFEAVQSAENYYLYCLTGGEYYKGWGMPPEGYYLCFSGGKDSVVIYDLAVKAGVKFDAHHNITTVEPPQLMKFIYDHYPDVINEHPTTTMYQLIVKKKIPPLRLARYCCAELKERGGKGRVKITGIRSEESPRRAKRPQIDTSHDNKTKLVHVIKGWTVQDVWQYIRDNNLPYCELYDMGFSRIGCVLCPFQNYAATQRDLEMFPAIADYYRRACRKSFEVNRDKLRNWTSGDDMFNWWINERRGYTIAEDCNSIPLFSEDDGSIL